MDNAQKMEISKEARRKANNNMLAYLYSNTTHSFKILLTLIDR